jgi:hypothetical protein
MVTLEEGTQQTAEYWLTKSIDERLAAAAILINQRIPKFRCNRIKSSVSL